MGMPTSLLRGAAWETSSWVDTAELVLLPRAPAPPTPGGCALRPVPVVNRLVPVLWGLRSWAVLSTGHFPAGPVRRCLCVPLWPAAPAPRGWYSNSSRSSAASGPMSVGKVARGEDLGGPSPGPGPPLSGFPPCGARRPGKASVPAPPGADLRALWRGRQHLRGGDQGAGLPAAGRGPVRPGGPAGRQNGARCGPAPGAVGTWLPRLPAPCTRHSALRDGLLHACPSPRTLPAPPMPFRPLGRM